MSNARLLEKVEVTSSVNSVNVLGFTEEYDKYIVSLKNIETSNATYIHARVIDFADRSIPNGEYDYSTGYAPSSGSTWSFEGGTDKVEWESLGFQGSGSDYHGSITMQVFNPASSTSYTSYTSQCVGFRNSNIIYGWNSIGNFEALDPIKGIEFFPRAGTIDNAIIHVYGIRTGS